MCVHCEDHLPFTGFPLDPLNELLHAKSLSVQGCISLDS